MNAAKVLCLCLLSIVLNVNASVNYFFLNQTNGEKSKILIKDLEALPVHTIKTATIYTPQSDFIGVRFSDFITKYNIKGTAIKFIAWDDYTYSIKVEELIKYDVIIAYKQSNNYMVIDDFGPIAVIYPRDEHPELNGLDVDAKTVVQVKTFEVE